MAYTEDDIKEIDKYNMVSICVFKAEENKAFNIYSSIQMAVSIYIKNPNIRFKYYHITGNAYYLYAYYKKPIGIKINDILKAKLKNFIMGYLMGIKNI